MEVLKPNEDFVKCQRCGKYPIAYISAYPESKCICERCNANDNHNDSDKNYMKAKIQNLINADDGKDFRCELIEILTYIMERV